VRFGDGAGEPPLIILFSEVFDNKQRCLQAGIRRRRISFPNRSYLIKTLAFESAKTLARQMSGRGTRFAISVVDCLKNF
jgi:hypothetical protein